MRNLSLYILFHILLMVLGQNALAGAGTLTGDVTLDYAAFSEREGAVRDDSSHFAQRVGLLYKKRDLLMGGRLGNYRLKLGGEATRLHSTSDLYDENSSLSSSKLYYDFEALLAPRGLPFRLNVFAYDLKLTSFKTRDRIGQQPVLTGRKLFFSGHIMDPDIYSDISNGVQRTMGATLLVGIRNGSYLGRYRELLSTLPRLLVDYKQTITRDMKSFTPVNTRERDLAFVSLNKKDNWLHYRLFDYTDYINPHNDYQRRQVILGVIDPLLNRKWINLTNWIQLSADLTYTKESRISVVEEKEQYYYEHSYDLNLFTNYRRSQLAMNNLTHYHRSRINLQLDEELNVPIFGNFEENKNSLWRFFWESRMRRADDVLGNTTNDEKNHFMRLNLDTWRTKDYNLTLGVAAEQTTSIAGEMASGELSMELGRGNLSRQSRAKRNDCRLRLESRWLKSSLASGEERSRFEQRMLASYEQPISSRWTLGLKDSAFYRKGENVGVAGDNINISGDLTLDGQGVNGDESIDNQLTLFANHTLTRNISNRVQFVSSWLRADGLHQQSQEIFQRLTYHDRFIEGSFSNRLQHGDFKTLIRSSSTLLGQAVKSPKWLYIHNSYIDFRPSRAFAVDVKFDYSREIYDKGGNGEFGHFEQSAKYSLWVTNGVIRKIFEVTEGLEWEWVDNFADDSSLFATSLQFDYYPTSSFFIGCLLTNSRYDQAGYDISNRILARSWVGVNYSKFKLSCDYSYGLRPETDNTDKRVESLVQIKVTKII